MADQSLAKLADLLVNYSVELQPGQLVRIDGGAVAKPLLLELYRAALRTGANPFTRISLEQAEQVLLSEGTDEQLGFVSDLQRNEIETIDAWLTVWGERNTRALGQSDPERARRR